MTKRRVKANRREAGATDEPMLVRDEDRGICCEQDISCLTGEALPPADEHLCHCICHEGEDWRW